MNISIIYTFISVTIVSFISLLGVLFLGLKKKWLDTILIFLIAFASGVLLGDAFIHLLPEALEKITDPSIASFLVLMGLMTFFALENIFHIHHVSVENTSPKYHPFVFNILIGDALHNFLDGVLIATSFLSSTALGISTSMAVIAHEIPQEIGDFGALLKGGLPTKKALAFNLYSALTAILGAIFALFVFKGSDGFVDYMIPITAGAFIYMALADLIPTLLSEISSSETRHKATKHSVFLYFFVLVGILVMWFLTFLEG